MAQMTKEVLYLGNPACLICGCPGQQLFLFVFMQQLAKVLHHLIRAGDLGILRAKPSHIFLFCCSQFLRKSRNQPGKLRHRVLKWAPIFALRAKENDMR